jgi:glycosyltransferase involved in cell wall biosynthesis
MKIIQVIDFLNVGGAERVCVSLCNSLYNAGHKIELLLLCGNGVLNNSLEVDLPIHQLKRKRKFSLISLYRCAKIMQRFDVVHVHMRHNYRYVKLVKTLFLLQVKVILHDHYGDIDRDISVPFGLKLFFKPSYYIGVSESLRHWGEHQLGVSTSRVFLLTNSISKRGVKHGKEKKGFVLVGNIKPIKNQLFAIELMSRIDTTLTIYGAIQDERYYRELLETIKKLDIEHKIHFIHDCITIQDKLPEYEFGLQTAISESGPLVLIEYLAQSLPFLGYRTGQVALDIEKKQPSLIIDNFELDCWEERIHQNSKINAENLKRLYETLFNEKKYLERCLLIYKRVLEL